MMHIPLPAQSKQRITARIFRPVLITSLILLANSGFTQNSATSAAEPGADSDIAQDFDAANIPASMAGISGMIVESNVLVTMRDGVNIALDIYRPSGSGTYPALYAAAPYPHTADDIAPATPETGPVEWFVNQGFSYVIASIRGTGHSEGEYQFLSREEQQDHYEIIEWIAEQSWSDGKVAGFGAGYYGTSQLFMGIQNPPHLECLAPYNPVFDPARDWAFPGGLTSQEFAFSWYESQVRDANYYETPGRLVEYDLRKEQLQHSSVDDYWEVRTAMQNITQISVPVFLLRSWSQSAPGLNSTFRGFKNLTGNNKLLITYDEQNDLLLNETVLQTEILPFLDWCLRDPEQTEHIEKPEIRYYVRGQFVQKPEITWPPGNVELTPLFLTPGSEDSGTGLLSFNQVRATSPMSGYGTNTEQTELVFISDVLENDLEIAGPVRLELYANSSATNTAFQVTLSEQLVYRELTGNQFLPSFLNPTPDTVPAMLTASTEVEVSSGALKASARASDPELSSELGPVYALSEPAFLNPGNVYRFDVVLQQTAYKFKQGNRIIVKIRKAIDGSLLNTPSQENIYHSNRYPSRLWLPISQLSGLSRAISDEAATTQSSQTGFSLPTPATGNNQGSPSAADLFNSDNPIILIP